MGFSALSTIKGKDKFLLIGGISFDFKTQYSKSFIFTADNEFEAINTDSDSFKPDYFYHNQCIAINDKDITFNYYLGKNQVVEVDTSLMTIAKKVNGLLVK